MAKNLISGDTTTIVENGNDIAVDLNTNYKNIVDSVGSVGGLDTTHKDTLVDAINEVNERDIYYTTEKVIGKWIDDKPIYRKVITANSYSAQIATGITNIDTMVKMEVLFSQTSEGDWRNIPWFYANNSSYGGATWAGGFFYKMSTNQLYFQMGNALADVQKIVAILEYTKTTD